MNCFKCNKEKEPAGYICQQCLDKAIADEQQKKHDETNLETNGEKELSQHEAVIAMLSGEVLDRGHNVEEKFDGEQFVYRIIGEKEWTPKPLDGAFVGLRRRHKTRNMDTFECLAWVTSPESQGWMVSIRWHSDDCWGNWDIPQRFKYDGMEGRGFITSDYLYRRAKILADKSGIDYSTIQGFTKEGND